MKKWIILLIVIVVLAGGGFYVYNIISQFRPPEIIELSNEWGEVTGESSTINTDLIINNPNPIEFKSGALGISYTVDMNGIEMARGSKKGLKLVKGRNKISLSTKLDNTMIPEWFKSHVERGESTTVRILPKVSFNLQGQSFSADIPEQKKKMHTDLLGALNSKETREIEKNGKTIIEIRDIKADWGRVSGDEIPIHISMVAYNPHPVPIPVTRMDYRMKMNTIAMVEGTSNNPALLAPKEKTELDLDAYFKGSKLDKWWVSHLRKGEETEINVTIDGVLEIGGTEVPVRITKCSSRFKTEILNPQGQTKTSGPECENPRVMKETGEWLSGLTKSIGGPTGKKDTFGEAIEGF